MKNILFSLILYFVFINVGYSQKSKSYYLVGKNVESLVPVFKQNNVNKYLTLEFENEAFSDFLADKKVVSYEKSFPNVKNDYLNKVFTLIVQDSIDLENLRGFTDVIQHSEEIFEGELASLEPNDYMIPPPDRLKRNDYLDLIRAPLAWSVTKGDSNILIGIADTYFTYSHEDLANKIVDIIGSNTAPTDPAYLTHGTGVSYMAAGDTDNNKGGASIGYNTKLVGYGNGVSNAQAVYQLSQYPGVKVINMSWNSPGGYSAIQDTLYNYIHNDLGILLTAAAGNRQCGGQYSYCYPASYESVLSVTGIGSRNYRGTIPYSWEDIPEVTIGDTSSTMNINDKVDISAPAYGLFRARNLSQQGTIDTYVDGGEGTSLASPIVAGAAALVFAANPNLTAPQVKQILKETTDDIYHLPQNQPYLGKLGTGRLNAFRAVMAAKCIDSINGSLDLMVRDNYDDYGQQPNNSTNIFWESVDIWIRNQPDGKDIRDTENPQYSGPGSKAYVYVRVTNKSCVTSMGTEELELYWAKASTSLDWKNSWDGSIILNGQPMGGIVNTLEIPSLEPGEDTIIEFEWDVPNPEDYEFLNDESWHYCLLARINTTTDPMATPETQYITTNVKNNNNLAWKNISVITVNSEDIGTDVSKGAVILVGNPAAYPRNMRLKLFENKKISDIPLYQQAEIRLKLSPEFSNIITPQTNFVNLIYLEQDGVYLVTDDEAYIENLSFDPFEMGTLYLGINFLATQVTDKNNFDIKIAQYDEHNLVGGETFLINKEYNNDIFANISSINIGSNIMLQSTNTYPQTIYNWYDSQNNLLYSGSDFIISNTVADVYKLEIISEKDGFKDYAEIIINGNSSTSLNIYPNPTNSVLNIDYDLQGANGYINITNINNNSVSNNYILNNMVNTIAIDVSNYANGYYNVAFVKNGSVYKSAIFIKK